MPKKFKILNPEVVEETLFRCGMSRNALIRDIGGISSEMVHKAMRGEPVPQEAEGITDCAWLPLLEAIDRVGYENAREVLMDAARVVFALGEEEVEGDDPASSMA